MSRGCYRKLIFILLCSIYFMAYADESEENLPTYEYTQIFKSIPVVFEYLLDALEKKPEILERDDITVFNRNLEDGETFSYRDKRADNTYNFQDGESDNFNKIDESDNLKDADVFYKYRTDNNDIKSTNELQRTGSLFKKDAVIENIIPQIYKNKDKIKANENTKANNVLVRGESYSMDKTPAIFSGELFNGFDSFFYLDYEPEDVVDIIIHIEQLLEEHNNNKDK